ncbi:hypothetical protein CAPTEDRAFT_102315 [Capitella teleta]|uniref:Chaperone DnaJ C-terminal domain-containing protein n=1 Tax=Capitella teleta TaxID=283909 RepID=R7V6W7_CAPTE|nr:hypothetical protein CAPTEDRAFT_102315 [Capitella teleta]|eukprot:ELU11520.1 hypothetical protein CAPTEDRAFT_102315 [Capitella teleta]
MLTISYLFAGEVIKSGDIRCIRGEGMPQYKNPFEKGRLIIQFSVKFPPDNWIPTEQISQLEALLPERKESIIPDDAEECTLVKYDPKMEQSRRRAEAYDSDEEGMDGRRVQCASH